MDASPDEMLELLRAHRADAQAVGNILESCRQRLLPVVLFRLDSRLRRRVDASDVIQETFMAALAKLDAYLAKPAIPFFLWLRLIAGEKVCELHRRHLCAKKRSARREVSLQGQAFPAATSGVLADRLAAQGTSPSGKVQREETRGLIAAALERMDPIDREILALRHFELLSNAEAACVLAISETAASMRHCRAAKRLRKTLEDLGVVTGRRSARGAT